MTAFNPLNINCEKIDGLFYFTLRKSFFANIKKIQVNIIPQSSLIQGLTWIAQKISEEGIFNVRLYLHKKEHITYIQEDKVLLDLLGKNYIISKT